MLKKACVITMAAALLLLLPTALQGDLNSREAAALVDEYLADDCTAERRSALVEELRSGVRADSLVTQLKRAAQKQETMAAALDLATELRVRGLFKVLKKEVDGAEEGRVLGYLFKVQEDGAAGFLYDRWEEQAVDSPQFTKLVEGFTNYYVPLDTMGEFRDYLKSKDGTEEKKAIARRILLRQMDKDPENAELDIEEVWKEYYVQHKTNSVRFSISGTDVLGMNGWISDGRIREFGDNRKLFAPARMVMKAIPDGWQKQNFKLKIGVRVLEGNGAFLGLGTAGMENEGVWGPVVGAENWVVRFSGGSSASCKLKRGTWQTITFDFRYNNDSRVDYIRWVTIDIDGEVLVKEAMFNGKFERLVFHTGQKCEMVVGGVDYSEPRG